jgi:hypothetical protein
MSVTIRYTSSQSGNHLAVCEDQTFSRDQPPTEKATMLKIVLVTLLVVGLLAGLGIAWAKHKGYCSAEDPMQHITERISHKLDLNDE